MILPLFATALLLSVGYSQAVVYGGLCDSSNTCTDANTYCYQQSACLKGRCYCSSGYSYNSLTADCEAEKLIGDSCTTYCTAGSCTSSKCACSSGFTSSSDRRSCTGKALGETCTSQSQCQGAYVYSPGIKCNTTCQCQTGYKAYDSYSCHWYEDGESCSSTSACSPLYSSCTSSTCQCDTVSGTKYEWYTYTTTYDITTGECAHPSSTKDVGYGLSCTIGVYGSTARFCSSAYVCGTCPENDGTTTYECLSGVGQVTASYLAMIAALMLAVRVFF